MSLKKKILTGITSGFAALALGTFAMGQESTAPQTQDGQKSERKWGKRGGFKKGDGARRGGMRGLAQLSLTDAQKQQIRTIMESRRQNLAGSESVREELRAIREAKRAGTLTADQQARLKALREQRQAEARQIREQIEAILTPEQKAQLEQMKQQRQQRREEFRQKRQNRQRQTPQVQSQDN